MARRKGKYFQEDPSPQQPRTFLDVICTPTERLVRTQFGVAIGTNRGQWLLKPEGQPPTSMNFGPTHLDLQEQFVTVRDCLKLLSTKPLKILVPAEEEPALTTA